MLSLVISDVLALDQVRAPYVRFGRRNNGLILSNESGELDPNAREQPGRDHLQHDPFNSVTLDQDHPYCDYFSHSLVFYSNCRGLESWGNPEEDFVQFQK